VKYFVVDELDCAIIARLVSKSSDLITLF